MYDLIINYLHLPTSNFYYLIFDLQKLLRSGGVMPIRFVQFSELKQSENVDTWNC